MKPWAEAGTGAVLRCLLALLAVGVMHAAVSVDAVTDGNLILEDTLPVSVYATGITYPPGGRVIVTAAFSGTALFHQPVVEHDGVAAMARIIIDPLSDANGSDSLTVTVAIDDGTPGGGADRASVSRVITVEAVNDEPTMHQPLYTFIDEDQGVFSIEVGGVTPGPGTEFSQELSFIVVPLDASLVEVTDITYVSAQRTLNIGLRAFPDAQGDTAILISARDDGGTAFFGTDTTARVANLSIRPLNDPPVLARHHDLAVTPGGLATITTGELQVTDVDDPPVASLILTLAAAPAGELLLRGAPLVPGGTFSQADIDAGDIAYRHSGGATDTILLTYSDGIAAPLGPAPLLVTPTGLGRPEIHLAPAAPTWSEDGPATAIAPAGEITDTDSTTVSGGFLAIDLPAGRSGDVLSLAEQGLGAGQVSLSGSDVLVGGRLVATWSGGEGGSALTIAFSGSDATLDAMIAVLRAVRFDHHGDDPGSASRTVRLVAADGTAETSDPVTTSVPIIPVDDPPVLSAPWVATAVGVTREFTLSATDPDSAALTWSIQAQPEAGIVSVVDAAAGIFRLQPGMIGGAAAQIAIADAASTTIATLSILVTDGDGAQPLPASDPPREAFIGLRLDADLIFDTASLPSPGPLAFSLTGSPPAGLEISALGPATSRLSWPLPAGSAGAVLAFGVLAVDPDSRTCAHLPIRLRLHPQPGAPQ